MKNNNKAFTLIEVVGVITVLSLILLVSLPAITSTLKRNEQRKYDEYVNNGVTKPGVNFITESNRVTYFQKLPLYIEAIDDLTVSFTNNPIQYSLDRETWNDLLVGESTPTISSGSKVYFKASGLTPNSGNGIGTFNISGGTCNVGGNVMSMLYGDDHIKNSTITSNYQFASLFLNQNHILSPYTLF